jgi:hypothetical protein
VIKMIRMACLIAVTPFLLHLTALLSFAAENTDTVVGAELTTADEASESGSDGGENMQTGEETTAAVEAHPRTNWGGFTGYRFLSVDGFGGRAAEYNYLHSGVIGGGFLNGIRKDLRFAVDGAYVNDKDYHGDLFLDYSGDYRIHLRTESLFHNLDREQLFSPNFRSNSAVPDLAENYGIKAAQSLAAFRYKLHDFPLHVNLGYWRLAREGSSQLRFADQDFDASPNTIIAEKRPIDRKTLEGTVGFDSHLGPVDIIYDFLVRQFEDNAGIPRSNFVQRADILGNTVRTAGVQQHNEDPDSRYLAHSVKLHTSLAGGIVGAASYTYGKRENLSKLTDIKGADQASVTLHNVAGDFVYTPCKEFTLGMKYRRQEVNNNSPAFLTSSFSVPGIVAVRPSIDTQKDVVVATMSFKPSSLLTIKGEYKGEFLHRDLPAKSDVRLTWFLHENQDTHRGTVALLSRPLKGLRLSARYSYTATDLPSYGTSFAEKHEGELLAAYNMTNRWGATANYRSIRESNDQIERRLIIPRTDPVKYLPFGNLLSRDKASDNVTAGAWFIPVEKLTISANYGFLRNSTDQAVMFTVVASGSEAVANFTSQAHIVSLNAAYHYTEKLDLSLALQRVYSFSEFQPENKIFVNSAGNITGDTGGIKEISRLKTVETSFSTRGDYHLSRNLSCSLDYTLKDYDEKNSSLFDGTVHTVAAYVSTKW